MTRSFAETYHDTHGHLPFPWQIRLALSEELPKLIDIPTGCGKTSVLDVLAWRSVVRKEARRIVWVVDRRLVVDDVYEHARAVAETYGIRALKWRGGLTIDESWLLEPHARAIIVSTVDQVGSRLLFRGYGVPWKARPVYAGLLAFDTAIVLDEVHLSRPFAATLERVATMAAATDPDLEERLPPALRVIQMSATPGARTVIEGSVGPPFRLEAEDHGHDLLARRLRTQKWARLLEAEADSFVATVAQTALAHARRPGVGVVGVVVNRVDDARAVFEALRGDDEAILLTGRIRPFDRDLLLKSPALRRARPGRNRQPDSPPLFVVATQTIEVGVDLDFDALVTEAASMTPLRQRFGRLDRLGDLGESEATIILRRGTEKDDRVYGDELGESWRWLWDSAGPGRDQDRVIDLGLAAHHDWPSSGETELPSLSEDQSRVLSETHPFLEYDVDVARLLHGARDELPRVSLVWRRELNRAPAHVWSEVVDLCPPVRAEALALPRYLARDWMSRNSIRALRWRPGEAGEVVDAGSFERWGEIRHEDILLVPSRYRGNDSHGWKPDLPRQADDEGEDQDIGFHPDYRASDAFQGIERLDHEPEDKEAVGRFRRYPPEWNLCGGVLDRRERHRGKAQRESLRSHSAKARAQGEQILAELDLLDENAVAADVLLALERHDVGKADRRFQVMLHDGDEIDAASAIAEQNFLAKSSMDWWNVGARNRAWRASGLPQGWRHEVESVLRTELEESNDPDLVCHLILAHHGRGRPWLPAAQQELSLTEQANRFWRVQRRVGAWALGYLEALVVVSDRRASEDSEELADATLRPAASTPRPLEVDKQPGVDLVFIGNTFLGFMAALGTLHLLDDPLIQLSWNRRKARIHGIGREELQERVGAAVARSEFDPDRTVRQDGKRLPWDLCGAGRPQLRNTLPLLREELCTDAERLGRTLFGPWTWRDKGDPLGWVPSMRDHALRSRAPTNDSPYRENGALWLAWEGIAVVGKRPDRDEALGWRRSGGGPWTFVWPLWSASASLDTVRSLFRSTPQRSGDLGVTEWWSTSRVGSGGRSQGLTAPRPVTAADLLAITGRANRK